MSTTSITDLAYIDTTGYNYADYPTFLAWLQDQYRGIYGADVYLESDSQDGQFLAILALAFYQTTTLGAAVYNSYSPVTAQGVGLARNVKINGLTKHSPSYSTVTLTIVGTAGTVITNGIAQDTLGQKWILDATVTIPGGGTTTQTATAETIGAVTASAATITTIFTPTRGWQTVNNIAAATPGSAVETDAELRLRQAISTADPSLTVFDGTVGGIANLTGVTKVRGYENATGSTDSNSIPAHSISCVVVGGTTAAICAEIALHKTPGTGTYGDTSTTVYDARGMPLLIAFERGLTATISVELTLSVGAAWSTDYEALIQAAVSDYISALPIGDLVLLTKIYAPAYLFGVTAGQTYSISLLRLKKNSGSFAASNVTLLWNENPVCATTDVSFIIT